MQDTEKKPEAEAVAEERQVQEHSSSKDSPAKKDKEKEKEKDKEREKEPRSEKDHKSRKVRIMMPPFDSYLLTVDEFTRYQDPGISEKMIEKCFRKYKNEYISNDLRRFYDHVKDTRWFEVLQIPKVRFSIEIEQIGWQKDQIQRVLAFIKEGRMDNFSLELDLASEVKHSLQPILFEATSTSGHMTERVFLKNPKFFRVPQSHLPAQSAFLDLHFIDYHAPVSVFEPATSAAALRAIPNFVRLDLLDQFEPNERFHGFLCFNGTIDAQTIPGPNLRMTLDQSVFTQNSFTYLDFEFYALSDLQVDVENMRKLLALLFTKFDLDFTEFDAWLAEKPLEVGHDVMLFLLFHAFFTNYYHRSDVFNLKQFSIKNGKAIYRSSFANLMGFDRKVMTTALGPKGPESSRSPPLPRIYDWLDRLPHIEKSAQAEMEAQLLKKFDKRNDHWGCHICEKVFQSEAYILKHFRQRHQKEFERDQEDFLEDLNFEAFHSSPFCGVFCTFEKIHCHFKPGLPEKVSKRGESSKNQRQKYIVDFATL